MEIGKVLYVLMAFSAEAAVAATSLNAHCQLPKGRCQRFAI
ncbi:MAG: hypothetical protein OXE78_01100 [Gammaproteobacteria bacterium]|nr:hypothetical protein [Gammaproteobacteria bacterium]